MPDRGVGKHFFVGFILRFPSRRGTGFVLCSIFAIIVSAISMGGSAEQGKQQDENSYSQPVLTGFEAEKSQEELLEHVVIEALPVWKQRNKGYDWDCQAYARPDIFQQERAALYEIALRYECD